jgi:hypothetical protein
MLEEAPGRVAFLTRSLIAEMAVDDINESVSQLGMLDGSSRHSNRVAIPVFIFDMRALFLLK